MSRDTTMTAHNLEIVGRDISGKAQKVYGQESVLCLSLTVWYGSATKDQRRRLNRVVRNAGRNVGCERPSLEELYCKRTVARSRRIIADRSHPANDVSALAVWRKVQGAEGTDQPAQQQLLSRGHRCSEPGPDCLNTVNVVYCATV